MADKPFPTTEADLNLLLQTLKAKLPLHSAALGLTPAEITAESEDAENFNYLITMAPQVMDAKAAYFAFKDLLRDGDISSAADADLSLDRDTAASAAGYQKADASAH